MGDLVPKYAETSIDTIPGIAKGLRLAFASQKTKPIEWRKQQLRKLYWSIVDNEPALVEALKSDVGKSYYESYLTEIDWCKNDIIFVTNNLDKWAKDTKPADISFNNKLMSPRIRKDPLGAVLVIGAYNFPLQLSLGPFIGAVAAGNTAVLKPSEQAPATAMVMQKILAVMDPACFQCVQGAIPETTKLLDEHWDKIFYTGSANVGKIIAKRAAEHLTPVTLELGGKNPAIITRNADIKLAAKRLLWSKFLNAGQVCISQNYHLVDKEVAPAFIEELKKNLASFMPQGARASPDYGRIATTRQWARLKKLLDETSGKIVYGGTMDEADRFLEPTIVEIADVNDPLIAEETFGPILSVFPVANLDEAIRVANEVDPTPLGAYPFGTAAEVKRVLQELRSGGATINDGMFHGAIPTLQFGGVGTSGQGAYRGKASFDCFTHERSVTQTPSWLESLLDVRYPPYAGKLVKFQGMNNLKPNFDREGRESFSPLKFLLTLGAGSAAGGASRYAVLLIAAAGIRRYLEVKGKL